MKKLLIWFGVVAALILIAAVAAFLAADTIIENGIEYAATYALGVKTTLESTDIELFGGAATLNGLAVENPAGFEAPLFLSMGTGTAEVTLADLLGDPVTVPMIRLSNLAVHLEQNLSSSNYGVILDNLSRFEEQDGGAGREPEPPEQPPAAPEEGKRFKIEELVLDNIRVTARVGSELTGGFSEGVTIESIRLHDIGTETEDGVLLSQLAGVVVKAILAAAAEHGVGLPGDIAAILKERLSDLDSLEEFAPAVIGEVESIGRDAADEARGEIEERLEDAADDVFGRINEMLGGEEEEEPGGKRRRDRDPRQK